MIYIETKNTLVTYTHYMPFDQKYGLGKTREELLKTGYLVESVPEYSGDIPERKRPELHYDGAEFSWVMVDNPNKENAMKKEIESLKVQQQSTSQAVLGLMDMLNASMI